MFRLTLATIVMVNSVPLVAQTATPDAQPLPRATFNATMDGEYRKIDTNKDG